MKPDERHLLRVMQSQRKGTTPRDIIEAVGIPAKRVWYLLEKWTRKGWYAYGVTVDLGWLTDAGRAINTGGEDAKEKAA